jgi:hypothetical protein
MAKSLVTYMSDARAIRSAILAEFNSAPTVRTIVALREAHLREKVFLKRGKMVGSGKDGESGTGTLGSDVHRITGRAARSLLGALWEEHPRILENLGAARP